MLEVQVLLKLVLHPLNPVASPDVIKIG
jgi:hypothetical protein